jgi:preprotein translocase subunit SecG
MLRTLSYNAPLKIRYYIVAIIFLIASMFVTPSRGQTSSDVAARSSAVARVQIQSKESPELIATRDQVRQLQTQVQVMKEYHSSLLDTVYWALGGVFLVVSIILGFGWFANFRIYERDKQFLREELDAQLKVQNAELSGNVQKLAAELKQSIADQTTEASIVLKGKIADEIQPLAVSISKIDRRVFKLDLDQLKEKMEADSSDNMALTKALGLLQICQERAQDELPEIINFMLKKVDKGGRFTAKEITRVNAILDVLPSHYKALCDRLRTKLVESNIFG